MTLRRKIMMTIWAIVIAIVLILITGDVFRAWVMADDEEDDLDCIFDLECPAFDPAPKPGHSARIMLV